MILVTMGEGKTSLIESVRIGPSAGLARLFFKLEICNPSGSYKDRFIASEMSRMVRLGLRVCAATSSGNTGSSLAAYGARYGVKCVIVVSERVPAAKLLQMMAHGARIFRVKNFGTSAAVTRDVFQTLTDFSETEGVPLVVSAYRYCAEGMASVERIAEELREQCSQGLDHVFVPVGGGGLFVAVCRGFARSAERRPFIHAVQPQGCSTVVAAFARGDNSIRPVESTTRISGLAVPFDIDATLALEHLRQSGGRGFAVSDQEVFEAQRLLLEQEGLYCEPAGAAALAGLRLALRDGIIRPTETVVCLLTGHGFKDQDSIERAASQNPPLLVDERLFRDKFLEVVSACESQ